MAELRGPAAERGYEPSDVSVKAIALILLTFAVVGALSIALVLWLHPVMQREALDKAGPPDGIAGNATLPPPAIRLQAQPLLDIAALHRHEDAILGQYGWVDRADGIARIPIGEAMKRVVGKSLDEAP